MDQSPDALPPKTKECLRLAATGLTSKEIAPLVGLSWMTVDTYLSKALPLFGVDNRRDAGRAFVRLEESRRSGYEPQPVVEQSSLPDEQITSKETDQPRGRFGFLPVGGGKHDLSWGQVSYHILRVASVGTAVVIGLALAIAGALATFQT